MVNKESSPSDHDLKHELVLLRQEVAGLRAVQAMHHDTEEDLHALERQLASIIHSAMDGIIAIDDEHNIVLFNTAAEVIFQCSASEVLGKPLDQFIPESMRSAHHEHLRRFAESGETYRRMGMYREISGLRYTGEAFPLEASISKVERFGKRWMTVILRDISQRKQSEERAEYLGQILDESLNELYVFDAETLMFLQVNKGALKNLGYSMAEMSIMTPVHLKPEFTHNSFHALLEPLLIGKSQKLNFRTNHRRKNGTTYPVEVHLQHRQHAGRGVFVAIILDLTDQIEIEKELQEAQRTLASLLRNLPGLVYRCDHNQERTMQFISPSCEELTGYPSKAFVEARQLSYGKDLIHPEDRERVWQETKAALNDCNTFQLSYRLKCSDDSVKWVWEQGCGVFAESGKIIGCEGYVVDMTQQRALEDQLRKAERVAELGTLASGMAHEIGTPMNVILGRAELLIRKAKDESTRRGLETIVTQVERITKIMNQLLSFARKRPSEKRDVDLVWAIGNVLDMLLEKFKSHGIQVVKEYSPDLPQVLADSDHIIQVLLNLLLNACQAMPEGGTLTLKLCPKGDMVELSVQDTGIGIHEDQVSKIFDPFFTTKAVGEGTGLGLTVVHGIIQENNGTIRVNSIPGQGSTFIISLPVYSA
jgi:PAS domain S-box-containing protein